MLSVCMCVCVCVCARARACAGAEVRGWFVGGCVPLRERVRVAPPCLRPYLDTRLTSTPVRIHPPPSHLAQNGMSIGIGDTVADDATMAKAGVTFWLRLLSGF